MDGLTELKEFIARMQAQTRSQVKSANSEQSQKQDSDSSHGALKTKAQPHQAHHSQSKSPQPGYAYPSRDVGLSTFNPATPSPAKRGIVAPQNTPLVTTTDPDTVLVAEKEAAPSSHEVGDAIFDYLKAMEGKPLTESMWAPKSVTQRRPLAQGLRKENISPNLSKSVAKTWEGLAPRKVVEPKSPSPVKNLDAVSEIPLNVKRVETKPAINKTLTRMPHQQALLSDSREATPNSPAIKSAAMESKDVVPVKTVESKSQVIESMPRMPHLKTLPKETRQENQKPASTKDTDTTSDRLVPVKLVEPKPDINETFTRMSFKAADPRSQPSMVDAFTQTEDARSKSKVIDFAPSTDPHDIKDEESQPGMPPHKPFSLPASDAAQKVNRQGQTISPSTPPPAPEDGSDSSTTPTQTSNAPKPTDSPKSAIHGDTKPEQTDLPLEFLKKWAYKNKALLTKVAQSNGGSNSKPGQSTAAAADSSSSAISKPADENEDRRFMQYFSTWGTQEKRDRPPAEVRTAILKPLPPNATLAFVANLVYGGPLEKIRIHVGGKGASVTFLNPADCKRFFDNTGNGLAYSISPSTGPVRRFRHLEVELSDVVEPVVGKLYEYVQKGLTRCVKAVPVDDAITMAELQKMAADKNRSVVKVQEGRGIANARYIVFHFGNIEHAVQFRASLARDDEFEQCNLSFAKDPCAEATGPRT